MGRCAAAGARLLGASCITVADRNRARLDLVKGAGFEIVDTARSTPVADQIEAILGHREVDCGVDCVGLEALLWRGGRRRALLQAYLDLVFGPPAPKKHPKRTRRPGSRRIES